MEANGAAKWGLLWWLTAVDEDFVVKRGEPAGRKEGKLAVGR